jgi:hypothetical protein
MLPGDDFYSARRAAAPMIDERFQHFHDPNRRAGLTIARSLAGIDKPAWDVYLFYGPRLLWEASPPAPTMWAHQLAASKWAEPKRYFYGAALRQELSAMAARMLGGADKS